MLTNFNIFGFGDLKLVFLQIGWSYLDNSGTLAYAPLVPLVLLLLVLVSDRNFTVESYIMETV